MDPQRLPAAIRHLVPAFEKWGAVQSDTERYALQDKAKADPELMQELADLKGAIAQAWDAECDQWYKQSMIGNRELAKVYFTGLLLHELGVENPPRR